MTKVPVQKIVNRNGTSHVQTYWEASDPNGKNASKLSGQPPKLPAGEEAIVRDRSLRDAWRSYLTKSPKLAEVAEEFIRAGLAPSAASVLSSDLAAKSGGITNDEIIDHLYEHGLIDQPAPKAGWSAIHTTNQKKLWDDAGVPAPTAIEWIDAGFPSPHSGIPELVNGGVSAKRAKEWTASIYATQPDKMGQYGSGLWMFRHELKSKMSVSEAEEWRKVVNGHRGALEERDLEMHRQGFTAKEAVRWNNVTYGEVTVEQLVELKKQKWSPSNIKSALSATRNKTSRSGDDKLGTELAAGLITASARLGSVKTAIAWVPALTKGNTSEGYGGDRLERVVEAERFKDGLRSKTGLDIAASLNSEIYRLDTPAQETLLEMAGSGMTVDSASAQNDLILTAEHIGSPSKLELLRRGGYKLTKEDGRPVRLTDSAYSRAMNPETSSPAEINRWLRYEAASIYADYLFHIKDWVDDDRVDPAQFKTLLEGNPSITSSELEATLIHGINKNVADGWL